jgi:two-component system, cell cycle response regulator
MAPAPHPADAAGPRAVRGMRVLLALGALVLALFLVHVWTGAGPDRLFDVWTSDTIGAIAVAVCLVRAATTRTDRVMWGAIGIGLALWVAGAAYWDHLLSDDATAPLPSVADLLFLGFYPFAYVAVVAAVRRHGHHVGVGAWFDGLIAVAAIAAVGAELVVEPIVRNAVAGSTLGTMTNLAYPIGDVVLIAALLLPSAMLGTRVPRGMALLAIGLAVFAVTDAIYLVQTAQGTYAIGGLLDAGWYAGMLLIAAGAASRERLVTRAPARTRGGALLPALGGVVALVVITLQVFHDRNVVGLVASVVTLVLVIARMLLSLRETGVLLEARARDAVTDGLTGLPNRRALVADLDAALVRADEHPVLLVLFDLDGFKAYNDTFGHLAGDALLIRIGGTLRDAGRGGARAYRMGGDEFCALVTASDGESPERIGAELAAAMGQHGAGFDVTASFGCAVAPLNGRESTALLRHADDEMYARKGTRRAGAERQVQDALLAALRERDPELESHADGVAGLAAALGRGMRVGATELRTLVHAAALHDVGKIAIPDGILHKPAPLDAQEWRFVRSHPLIAQRIISAAPALAYAAQLVRSTQERWDGDGYPDGLRGEEIPLAARIVALCSAYQAMTSERPYQRALAPEEAFAELRRGAGTQFDPQLVELLIDVVAHPERHAMREGAAPTPLIPARGGTAAGPDSTTTSPHPARPSG